MTVHIDNEQLAELKEVLEDEFGILISTYLADAKLRLQLIEQGLQNQDYEAVRLAAHSLKGASANLGALLLAQICERLEHDCKAGHYAIREVVKRRVVES
ncbi:MAG: Hpt domain-containing protein [Moraxellaceae bacterium]|nr:Hpt domain-containing protein [Moraxellaceae bacterium]